MRFSKRGQTATEYLIILAVVIIIALIVVGVLGGIPGIGGGASSAANEAYWSTRVPVAVTSFKAANSDDDSITLRNSGSKELTILELYTTETISATPTTRVLTVGDVLLNPGDSFEFTNSANGQSGMATTFVTCNYENDPYTADLTIRYSIGGITYNETGKQPVKGICAS